MYSVVFDAVMMVALTSPAHPGGAGYRQSAGCQGATAGYQQRASCQGGSGYGQRAGCSGGMAYGAGCQGSSAGYQQSASCSGGSGGQARGGPVVRILANRRDARHERRDARQHARAHRFAFASPSHGETIYQRETIYTERLRTFCG